MADVILIKVSTSGDDKAVLSLSKIQAAIDRINKTPVNINIDQSTAKALNAQAKIETAVQKRAASENRLAVQIEKTKQATESRIRAEANLANQVEKTAQAQIKAETATKKLSSGMESAGKSSQNAIGKFTEWLVIGNLVTGTLNAVTGALDTMKAVDSELTTISKVMDASEEQLKRLENQAYDTASAYGVAADEYLSSVAEFARAGYEGQSDALGELAIKTQLVGDVTAQTANQFLLSVDAAYKYGGSIEKLTRVLDGANEVDNKYATSIEAIAEGMGIVAPVAAQAHVGVEELTAAIGTITAVTQRSGSEAARALRALFLNIIGDTKTEVEDGATWTAGEIAGLRDVLEEYAPAAVAAAEATGSVINPMEAIAALSEAMKSGLLTEQELMEQVSDIGGKLRTSQLLALIQNWDMYSQMLKDIETSAGSADKEVSKMLDSWERKTEVLNNTWTKFVSNMLNTDEIKAGLDVLIGLVEVLDTDAGRAVVTTALLATAVSKLGGVFGSLKVAEKAEGLWNFVLRLKNVITTSDTASEAVGRLGSAFNSLGKMSAGLKVALVIAAVQAAIAVFDALNVTLEEAKEKTEALKTAWDETKTELAETESELETLAERIYELENIEGPTLTNKQELFDLRKKNEELALQVEILKEREKYQNRAFVEAAKEQADKMVEETTFSDDEEFDDSVYNSAAYWGIDSPLEITYRAIEDYNEGQWGQYYNDAGEYLSYRANEIMEHINLMKEIGATDSESYRILTDELNQIIDTLGITDRVAEKLNETMSEAAGAAATYEEAAADLEALKGELSSLQEAYGVLSGAVEEFNETGGFSLDTYMRLIDLGPEYLDLLETEGGQLKLNTQAYYDLTAAKIESTTATAALNLLLEVQEAAAAGDTETLNRLASATNDVAAATWEAVEAKERELYFAMLEGQISAEQLAKINQRVKDYRAINDAAISGLGGSAAGASVDGSAKSAEDAQLNAYEKRVSLLESELDLLEAQGAPMADRVDKMREIQAVLLAQREYMQKIGAEQEDINRLTAEWYDWESRVRDALAEAIDKKIEAAKAQRDEQIAAIDAEIESLKREAEEEERLLELREKENAVLKARQDLLNAQNERTVRTYDAESGQWQWNADAQNVKTAEEALEKAEADLQSYTSQMVLDEEIEALEERKNQIEQAYNAFEEEWNDIKESILDPGEDIGDMMEFIADDVLPELEDIIYDVGYELEKFGETVKNAANKVSSGAVSGAVSGVEAGLSGRSYDTGGILQGRGVIPFKATDRDESVLGPDVTAALLSPQSDRIFTENVAKIAALFGAGTGAFSALGAGAGSSFSGKTEYYGGQYYFNGVKIGTEAANTLTLAQLAAQLRPAALYQNAF